MTDKPLVRRSYAEHVLSCPRFEDETGEMAHFGTAFHAFVDSYFGHCREIGEEYDLAAVHDIAHGAFFGEPGNDPNRWQEFLDLCSQFAQARNAELSTLLALEMGIRIETDAAVLTCIPDRIDLKEGPAPAPTWVVLTDYKTERAEMDHDFQRRWYVQMLFLRWPSLERITFVVDRVRWPRDPEIHEYERGQLDEWWADIMAALSSRLEAKDRLGPTGGPACEHCKLRARCAEAISPWRDLTIRNDEEVEAFYSEMIRHQEAYGSRREVLAAYFKDRPARLLGAGPHRVELGYLRPRKDSFTPTATADVIKAWFDANGFEGAAILKVDGEALTNEWIREKLAEAGLATYKSGKPQFKFRKADPRIVREVTA